MNDCGAMAEGGDATRCFSSCRKMCSRSDRQRRRCNMHRQRPPCMGLLLSSDFGFFLSHPFVRRGRPSLRPDLRTDGALRADAVKDAACGTGEAGAERVLDSGEHGASLSRRDELARDDRRGSPFRNGALAPQPCIRWTRRGPTMMQSCASAARLPRGDPFSPTAWCSRGCCGSAASDHPGPTSGAGSFLAGSARAPAPPLKQPRT
jgi:hypothetical protein